MSVAVQVGIKSFGVYIPRRRMLRAAIAEANAWALPGLKARGKGQKSFCNWDEDVITMAVEAARDSLRGFTVETLASIDLASTTAPYADNQNASIVAAALNAPSRLACADFGGSTRTGLTALLRALDSSQSSDRLVIASEKRAAKPGSVQEMTYGSAAASMLLGSGDDIMASLLGSESVTTPFIDHFRQARQKHDYAWEERWVRDEGIAKLVPDAVAALLTRIDRKPEQVAYFGFSGGPIGSDKRIVKQLGISPEALLPDLQGQIGDAGAAQPMLQLSAALEQAKAGDVIVLVCFANGCDVVALEMQSAAGDSGRRGLAGSLERGIQETAYTKMLSHGGEIELDWGMRAETDSKTALTAMYRAAGQILGFTGGKCKACAAIQFPRLPHCVECGAADSQESFSLSNEQATVATYTADWLMYTPAPPLYVGLVQFNVGARLLMEMVDVGTVNLDVGTPLEMVFRIKEKDDLRHFDRYFWKATPLV